MREWITDPETVIAMVDRHEIRLDKQYPFGGVIVDRFGLWRRVPRHLMRHLIGAGLVQPSKLGWSNGDWIFRLAPLGKKLVKPSSMNAEALRKG